LRAALADLAAAWGDRPASVSRELTKKFEETRRGTLRELLAWVESSPPRGEFVLVVGGAPRDRGEDEEERA
ncbi:MAG TPA: 16S rRNA (cytidine(1402)-2'-O)-methyltransferase, partial [Candidatus Omnitrophota bacterium]|nr:16S rRNA (cytidine(1402)-2'-O)-methyltransferase [Candidatus Omnitrophota bacterium]